MTDVRIGRSILSLTRGDITAQRSDAIVNAANSTLMGGGGVDGAIHRRGGPTILDACKWIRSERFPDGLPTGAAVVTTGGDLHARAVIHTVGPVWRGGERGEAELLARAYDSCLKLAAEEGLQSVAFPSISTGAYGYPIERASRIALETVIAFLSGATDLREVRFVLYSDDDLRVYEAALEEILAR